MRPPKFPPPEERRPQTQTSLRIDTDVLEWFKARGPNFGRRMNAVLRWYMEATEAEERGQEGGHDEGGD